MNGRLVSCVVFFFTVAITEAGNEASVDIWDTTVTLNCPCEDDDQVKWFKNDIEEQSSKMKTWEINNYTYKNDGLYYCSYGDPQTFHYFYIIAKVCNGCVDMDKTVAFAVVFTDVIITLGIVIMVYIFAKKKVGSAPPQRATQARPPRGQTRGPPIPDPDYQMLNPATRSNDVYAQAQSHRR